MGPRLHHWIVLFLSCTSTRQLALSRVSYCVKNCEMLFYNQVFYHLIYQYSQDLIYYLDKCHHLKIIETFICLNLFQLFTLSLQKKTKWTKIHFSFCGAIWSSKIESSSKTITSTRLEFCEKLNAKPRPYKARLPKASEIFNFGYPYFLVN